MSYDALAPATRKAPLTLTERRARTHDWQSYSAVMRFKDGNEDTITVQALNEDDARYRVGLRITKGDKILHMIYNGEAY